MAQQPNYHDESDADDEYERSVFTSPNVPAGYYDEEETDSDHTTENTPTTFQHSTNFSPKGLIVDWTVEQCADYVSNIGLDQYADSFIEEDIDGKAIVALQQGDLKDMGIASVGHRLTILKGVYDVKIKQNVPVEPDQYVPLSADANAPDAHATQDDVARIITQIKLRDERIAEAEAELRALRDDVWRVQEEQRKLREDTLPLIRLAKDKSAPLPTPDGQERGNPLSPVEGPTNASNSQASSLARKFSKKGLYLGGKLPSPTIFEGSGLEASAAATAASNHLTASMTSSQGQGSPRPSQQPSPTSPSYKQSRTFSERAHWSEAERDQQGRVHSPLTPRRAGTASVMNPLNTALASTTQQQQQQQAQRDTQLSQASTLVTRDSQAVTPSSELGPDNSALPFSSAATTTTTSTAATDAAAPSQRRPKEPPRPPEAADFMKSFRVGMEEPCYKVLPQALKRYNIHDDWRIYSLYIVHGDQERCLGLDERPLILFKQLTNEGKKPMFMLRRHASPAVGTVRTVDHPHLPGGAAVGAVAPGGAQMQPSSSAAAAAAAAAQGGVGTLSAGRQSYASPMHLPGGVL